MSKKNTMTNQLESILDDIIQGETIDDKQIFAIDAETLQIKTQEYHVVVDYRDGFQLEGFKHRYQEYFEKFDFIVGDWASDMLRLRGFYQIGKRKVPRDQQIDFLDDYLKEYCNFGAPYFVIAKVEALEKYNNFERSKSTKKATKKVVNSKPKQVHVSTPNHTTPSGEKNVGQAKKKHFKKSHNNQNKQKNQELVTEKVSKEHKFVMKKVKKS